MSIPSGPDHAAGYSRTAKLVHWASALLILVLLFTGFRAGFSAEETVKVAMLRIHLPVAFLVLILTVFRLLWWLWVQSKPAPLGTVPAWQEALARWMHRALYLLIFVLLGSGIAMSVIGGLPDAVFGTAPLPDLSELPPRAPHGIGARLILAAVLLHAGAAFYHHFIVRDRTLRRMWFGR